MEEPPAPVLLLFWFISYPLIKLDLLMLHQLLALSALTPLTHLPPPLTSVHLT